MAEKPKIAKEMKIEEVIKKYPKTVFLFIDYGLHCIGCPIAQGETIEEAAKVHNLNLEKFLEDLNKVAEKTFTIHQSKNK